MILEKGVYRCLSSLFLSFLLHDFLVGFFLFAAEQRFISFFCRSVVAESSEASSSSSKKKKRRVSFSDKIEEVRFFEAEEEEDSEGEEEESSAAKPQEGGNPSAELAVVSCSVSFSFCNSILP